MARFVEFNANYWKREIGDCCVRAISFATNMGYVAVCKKLGCRWRFGRGLVTTKGVSQEKFEPAFCGEDGWFEEVYRDDIVDEYFFGDGTAFDKEPLDPEIGDTVSDFLDLYQSQGRFLLYVRPPKENPATDDWHLVYANSNNQKVFDTWDCRNFLVFRAYVLVKPRLEDDDPLSRKSEIALLNRQLEQRRRKKG